MEHFDMYGRKLEIDDAVLYIHSASKAGAIIEEVYVIGFTEKSVRIKFEAPRIYSGLTQCVPARKLLQFDWNIKKEENSR